MKERPILFSGAMVRAILDGRKTQTRRIMNPQPQWRPDWGNAVGMNGAWIIGSPVALGLQERGDYWMSKFDEDAQRRFCTKEAYGWGARAGSPYGVAGDLLWVRETWAQPAALDPGPTVYRADYPACVPAGFENIPPAESITWKPSIHMPRALCRIELEITRLRVERLNDCSVKDAIAEGAEPVLPDPLITQACPEDYRVGYRQLWDSINGAGAWEANPWVWVVEFKRMVP